ncbi:lycopene cyclase domain-containing protein [Arthrobacter sp. zg-Y411]|uniref:lycopene cyclase domain-containing protein n=1 Tax=Arthrobacter TaxID=1663 RepID=UPI001D1541CD|nr:lycopene cyclase domain-containing protein [Arthrobacter sp. YD2]MCC3293895.1 lycopene cyclase domain-containing protein [Arthrobacter zhangbolii]MDN3903687.1 lycopene cyclase domain-containing protein [Arthrobacter sp. YD2]
MTYWTLNAFFLVPAALVFGAALLARRRTPVFFRSAAAVTAAVLLGLTAVFDNLMIRVGLFWYNEDRISGAFIGTAPLEDFAYPVAAVLLLPALWVLLPGRAPEPVAARRAAQSTPNTKENQ